MSLQQCKDEVKYYMTSGYKLCYLDLYWTKRTAGVCFTNHSVQRKTCRPLCLCIRHRWPSLLHGIVSAELLVGFSPGLLHAADLGGQLLQLLSGLREPVVLDVPSLGLMGLPCLHPLLKLHCRLPAVCQPYPCHAAHVTCVTPCPITCTLLR